MFLKLWQAGVEQCDELCGIDWDWLSMDGAMMKAPLGGEQTGPNPDFPRQKRGETECADRGPRSANWFENRGSEPP